MNNMHFDMFKTLIIARMTENPKLNISSDIVFNDLYNTSKVLCDRFLNQSILLEEHNKLLQLLNEKKDGS